MFILSGVGGHRDEEAGEGRHDRDGCGGRGRRGAGRTSGPRSHGARKTDDEEITRRRKNSVADSPHHNSQTKVSKLSFVIASDTDRKHTKLKTYKLDIQVTLPT